MNQSTHRNRTGAGSGGYRGNRINERSDMTNNEQMSNNACVENSPAPGTSNSPNQPEHADGYHKIPPNESRRSELLRKAQKEEEDFRRWKEENRPGPIQLPPERLGGAVSLTEVRQKQQEEAHYSKQKKKLRYQEMDRVRRQVEEEKNEKMKAEQREKANKLEMRRRLEDYQRLERYQHDKEMKTEEFLQRIERSSSTVSMAASNSIPASSWAKSREYRESRGAEENAGLLQKKEEQRRKTEVLEEKQKQQEEDRKRRTEADHRRVNSAFLDRLEAISSGRVSEPMTQTPESSNVWLDDDDDDDEPQDAALSAVPEPSQVHTDSAEEDDCDHMWTLMKLHNRFPYYERDMIEEIVRQCNGNYKDAYKLLNV